MPVLISGGSGGTPGRGGVGSGMGMGRRGSLAPTGEASVAPEFKFGTGGIGPANASSPGPIPSSSRRGSLNPAAISSPLFDPTKRRLSIARGEGMLISNYGGPNEQTTVSAAYLYNRRGSLGIGMRGNVIQREVGPLGAMMIPPSRPGISPFQVGEDDGGGSYGMGGGGGGSRMMGSISGESETSSRGSLSSLSTVKDALRRSSETVFTRKNSAEVGPSGGNSPRLSTDAGTPIDARLQDYLAASSRGRMSLPQLAMKQPIDATGETFLRRDSAHLVGGLGRTFGMLPTTEPEGHASMLSRGAGSRSPKITGSPVLGARGGFGEGSGLEQRRPSSPFASPTMRTRRLGSASSSHSHQDESVQSSRRTSFGARREERRGSSGLPPALALAQLRTARTDSGATTLSSTSSLSRLSSSSASSAEPLSAGSTSSGSEGERDGSEKGGIALQASVDHLKRIRHSHSSRTAALAERRRSSRISLPGLPTVGETVPLEGSALSSGSGSEEPEEEEEDEVDIRGQISPVRGKAVPGEIQQAFSTFSFPRS